MSVLLPDEKKYPLVAGAKELLEEGKGPIEIIKTIRDKERCSLTAAKDVYVMAAYDKSLYQYQEELIEPLEEVFDELEKRGAKVDRKNWEIGIDLNEHKK